MLLLHFFLVYFRGPPLSGAHGEKTWGFPDRGLENTCGECVVYSRPPQATPQLPPGFILLTFEILSVLPAEAKKVSAPLSNPSLKKLLPDDGLGATKHNLETK